MQTLVKADKNEWPTATFPSRGQRQEFLEQVWIWNRVDGLPRINMTLLEDGVSLRFLVEDACRHNMLRLIDAFGGVVVARFS